MPVHRNRCNSLRCQNISKYCLNWLVSIKKEKIILEVAVPFQWVIFSSKIKKEIMTRKERWGTKLFQLIWLQLNVQFVKKLSKCQSDWLMIFTQKYGKNLYIYFINYKVHIYLYQADISCTVSIQMYSLPCQWLKNPIRQTSADTMALHQ